MVVVLVDVVVVRTSARCARVSHPWVESLAVRRSGNRHGLGLARGQDMAAPLVRSGILDLHPTMTPDPLAELEQRSIELRSAAWTGNGHGNLDQNGISVSSSELSSGEEPAFSGKMSSSATSSPGNSSTSR